MLVSLNHLAIFQEEIALNGGEEKDKGGAEERRMEMLDYKNRWEVVKVEGDWKEQLQERD